MSGRHQTHHREEEHDAGELHGCKMSELSRKRGMIGGEDEREAGDCVGRCSDTVKAEAEPFMDGGSLQSSLKPLLQLTEP